MRPQWSIAWRPASGSRGFRTTALDAVGDGIAGGEVQDRRLDAAAAEVGEDGPAVAAGQEDVEDDEVVVAGTGEVQAVIAGGGEVDDEPGLREPLAEERGRLRLVFDDQQLHRGGAPVPRRDCSRRDDDSFDGEWLCECQLRQLRAELDGEFSIHYL